MKTNNSKLTRREFTRLTGTSALALPLFGFDCATLNKQRITASPPSIHLFSKHLQFLNYKEMSEAAAEMGFDGLDLTVRSKGHVLPESVEQNLPDAVEAIKNHGLDICMMTTNVLDHDNREDINVLNTASNLGFSHYRMGWLTYPENKTISESQALYVRQFKRLEQLNREVGLIGCYQNHAGNHVGAPIWDLPSLFKDTRNDYIGCQYDIRHAVVEGGNSWELGLRRVHPLIKSIVIKDFKWGKVNGKWRPINTPLGHGMVDFDRYFSLLQKYRVSVPISLHLEYDLGGAEHGASKININKKEVFTKMKKDLTYLKNVWQRAEQNNK